MAPEPTAEDVDNFLEFSGLDPARDRNIVITALKSNSNRDELASEVLIDGVDVFRRKYTWDDTAFGASRDGEPNHTGIAFNIEAPDNAVIQGVTPPPENGFYGPSAGAPSRPPSRTNNRSPLGAPSTAAQEEDDYNRAIRDSQRDADYIPQEAGVTGGSANAPHFGPANRSDYDSNSWAMVTTATSSYQTTVDDDPAPSARKREDDAPAFLVQRTTARTSKHHLDSVLTILHEIPLARNILLQGGEQAASYGHNSEWWKGQPIYAPHVLAAMNQGDLQWADDMKPDFYEEIHRLMAFLDLTERSYGSIDSMADLIPKTNFATERQFFDTLVEKTDADVIKPLTHLACPMSTDTLEKTQDPHRFAFLNFELTKSQYEKTTSLYEAWNWIVWHDVMTWLELNADTGMVVLDDMGEVMTVVIDGDGTPDKLDIPEVWYPERYLESRKEEAKICQEHLAWVHRMLYDAESKEFELTKWIDPKTDKVHNKEEMLEKTVKEYESHVNYLDGRGRFRELRKSDDDEQGNLRLEDVPCVLSEAEEELFQSSQKVLQRCKWQLAQVREKQQKLKWERERLEERKQYLNTILTNPDKPGLSKPFTGKKYLLRGIATQQNVTYVCKRAEPALIDIDETPTSVDQWWRLSYSAKQYAKAEKYTFQQVVDSIYFETKNPLLVYATEDAINTPVAPLSDALLRFAKAENKIFRQELNQETTEEVANLRNTNMSPISPSKRKYRSGSVDSMATNRASLGNSDTNSRAGDFEIEVDPFGDGDGTMDTEMTDLSTRQGNTETQNSSLAQVMYSSETQDKAQGYDTSAPSIGQDGLSTSIPTDDVTEISRTVTPDVDVEEPAKGPEMQERSGSGAGSPFMARHSIYGTAHDPRDEQKTIKMMDMEIPDEHQ